MFRWDDMKKRILVVVCLLAVLVDARTSRGFQQTKLTDELHAWIQQATPVEPTATQSDYDPSKISAAKIETLDLTLQDKKRSREIPLRVYLPKQSDSKKNAEVVLYSHGLGGSRGTAAFLGRRWAGRGYVAVFMQHPGSDDSVWKGEPLLRRMVALKKAANQENTDLRVDDVPVVINQLKKWNRQTDHPLQGRMNMKKIGMSGHSFGAVTTQHVGGQASFGKTPHLDKRITACIAMSPSAPEFGSAKKAFGKIKLPWLSMTGTNDKSMLGGPGVENRLAVYAGLPRKDAYELVLFGAQHSAFTGTKLRIEQMTRNPKHHQAIMAISTAFWDAYLRDDAEAKKWLTSDAVRSVLETKDRWQFK